MPETQPAPNLPDPRIKVPAVDPSPMITKDGYTSAYDCVPGCTRVRFHYGMCIR